MTTTSQTTVPTPDGPMDLYEALPDGKSKGAIVVIQEAFGVNEHIQDVTRRIADAGYRAVAPTLFHRAGGGTADYTDFAKVMPLFKGMSDAGTLMDVDAAVAHLRGAGFRDAQIGLVGLLLRRPRLLPGRHPAQARRGGRLLRRRHRDCAPRRLRDTDR